MDHKNIGKQTLNEYELLDSNTCVVRSLTSVIVRVEVSRIFDRQSRSNTIVCLLGPTSKHP